MGCFEPLGEDHVGLDRAHRRVLSRAVTAQGALPPFDNSAMDGYAVRAADAAGGGALPVEGESRAGGGLPQALHPGTAMRIFTGAPLPQGADAVVLQEQTQLSASGARFSRTPAPGDHVRRKGSDLQPGAVALAQGTVLGPGELALLASLGHATIGVGRKPRVAIVSSGDELREVGQAPLAGTIVNSNRYALAAQVQEAGGEAWTLPIVPDRLDALIAALGSALQADLVVTSGGVSVGEYDLMARALRELGVEQRFWKVAIKPGKPLWFGMHGGTPVVGLPGNPISAMVTFEVFVRPGLRRMLGDPRPHRESLGVRLAHPHRHSAGRTELARARLSFAQESVEAQLTRLQGSGSLPSMVGVDALVVLPAEQAEFSAGERLQALRLNTSAGSAQHPF